VNIEIITWNMLGSLERSWIFCNPKQRRFYGSSLEVNAQALFFKGKISSKSEITNKMKIM
jgi:hypothetical protein